MNTYCIRWATVYHENVPKTFSRRLSEFLKSYPHPALDSMAALLAGKTSVSTSGFPYISQSSFRLFLQTVPHLFHEGHLIVNWITRVEGSLIGSHLFDAKESLSLQRALQVMRNIVQSAAICSPPDLWILKHILSAHEKAGLTALEPGVYYSRDEIAERFRLDPRHLSFDLSFLYSRGYLRHRDGKYALSENPTLKAVYCKAEPIPSEFLDDMVDPIAESISEKNVSRKRADLVRRFYSYPFKAARMPDWRASGYHVEIGYRLVPTVLALRKLKLTRGLLAGLKLKSKIPNLTAEVATLLSHAGILDRGRLTQLGARVMERGPGPFGIIHAYVPYMRELENKLKGNPISTWVQRSKNIAASQDANRKTFLIANDSLDRFVSDFQFEYQVFIEHALGQGEATRQRLERIGEDHIQYFGADLEDAAIDRALALQEEGTLPKNMKFIRRADIANPAIVISAVRDAGAETSGAVMFVGNGFHEVRGQTNEKIIEVFKDYCEAGIILVFTEESALSDQDLRNTAWNTYHAGFRYVHELSGQGLRPAAGTDRVGRHSWKICASLGGYSVLPKYSAHTRTIYPFPRKGGYNPPISMTYFCVPSTLARSLGFYAVSWTSIHHQDTKRSKNHENQ